MRATGMSDDERDDESSEDGDFDPNKVHTATILSSCKCAPMYEVWLVLDWIRLDYKNAHLCMRFIQC